MALYGIDEKWEIDPKLLTISNHRIGRGIFGYVYEGNHNTFGRVAVKILDHTEKKLLKQEFFYTTKIWIDLNHPNIVKLLGICSQLNDKQLIISEFMEQGSLGDYIQRRLFLAESCNPVQVGITIALHICRGLRYLASNSLVFQNLFMNNIFVSSNGTFKLYRVWLCKKLVDGVYIDSRFIDSSIPDIRKMLPLEAISWGMFSVKSDVYSFGYVLEQMSAYFGKHLTKDEGTNFLETFLPIINACKQTHAESRPLFEEIEDELTKLFMDYDKVDEAVYNAAYYRALNEGQAVNTRIPLMIVGQDRAGKTSLRKHLQGLNFDAEEPSTCGIEVDIVEISDKSAEEPWGRKPESESFIMDEKKATGEVLKQAALFIHSKSNEGEESDSHSFESLVEIEEKIGQLDIAEEKTSIETLPKDTIDSIISLEKNIDKEQSTPVTALLHDLAGQCIFYDTHYYFLKSQCPYIVVYDLRNPLESPAQPRFKSKTLNIEHNLNNPLLATNLDYFLSWLNVLNKLRDSDATCGSSSCEVQLPPVLIALTNSDRFDGDVDEVKQKIKDIVKEKAFDNVFMEAYVVDNTASGKFVNDVKKLRRKIYDLCKSLLKMQRPIPISWFQLEAELSKKMSDEKRYYISFNEVVELGKVCKVEDVHSALKFLHHHGVVVHHEQSPIVIINPVWLMNLFTEVISVPEEDKPTDALHRKHLSQGILMKDYLRRIDHGEILEELMIQYGLICPWRIDDADVFIVPSVAPLMERGEDVQKQLSESPIIPIFFIFARGYILPGIFTKFLVKVINKYREYLRTKQPRLYSNYTLLPLRWEELDFDVYVIQLLSRIKVGVIPRCKAITHGDRVRFALSLKKFMLDCLEGIKDDKTILCSNIHSFVAVKCSVCCGEVSPCLRHDKKNCTSDNCGHYWSLQELRNRKDDPLCDIASVVQCTVFPLARVAPWLGIDEETFPKHEALVEDLDVLKRRKICEKLDVERVAVKDYHDLAGHLGMRNDDLTLITQERHPTDHVLKWAESKNTNISELREILSKMEREDCLTILDDST